MNWLVEITAANPSRGEQPGAVSSGRARGSRTGAGREARGGAAGEDAADQAGGEDAQDRGQRVGPRHVALGPAPQAGLDDRLGDLLRLGDDPAGQRFLAQLGGREALGRDEAGQHHADVDSVGLLLRVERVGPADQGELAGRVGAGAGAGDAAGGAGDVDDRARRGGAQGRQQRLGEADDGVEVELHVAMDVGVAALGEGRRARRRRRC